MNKASRIVYVHRRNFHNRPPVISVIQHLSDIGVHPYLITTGITPLFEEVLSNKGIPYKVIPFNITSNRFLNAIKGWLWGIRTRRLIKELASKENVILWIEGNYTFSSLSAKFINRYSHVLQHQEFLDPNYRIERIKMNPIKAIAPTAIANIAPEYNRAHLYRAFYKLKEPVFVLPNKATFFPSIDDLAQLSMKHRAILDKIGTKKVILYQGILSGERNLRNFLAAADMLDKDEYVTVVMGEKSPELELYKRDFPSLVHINYIPAPDYLLITSRAYIGILAYEPTHINLIYCAPNKIYEYGAYGVPMIGNDIPGLKYTIGDHGFGMICDENSIDDIHHALQHIIANHAAMSKAAIDYFNSVNNHDTIARVIDQVQKKGHCKLL